ncbi:MAG: alpha-N-arabinofuranosidase, partial [Clostridia bacterium]|nr:alpha-N-arabinofuranosidase [Clostridia bacterium]
SYKSKEGWDVPYVYSSVIDNEESDELVLFLANRSLECDIELDLSVDGYGSLTPIEHILLYHDDLNAQNTKDVQNVKPENVKIDSLNVTLKKHSWNMIRLKY